MYNVYLSHDQVCMQYSIEYGYSSLSVVLSKVNTTMWISLTWPDFFFRILGGEKRSGATPIVVNF